VVWSMRSLVRGNKAALNSEDTNIELEEVSICQRQLLRLMKKLKKER